MKTVFFDIDTQNDFMLAAGALYAHGAERVLAAVARLNHLAAARGIPLVSSVDAHAENDIEFNDWPPHCIAGTIGQQKPARLLLEARVVLPSAAAPLPKAPQIILEKQTLNCFSNQNLLELLREFDADRYVVYGVVTEICIRIAAEGLLRTGKSVDIVADAVSALSERDGSASLAALTAGGARLTTLAEIAG